MIPKKKLVFTFILLIISILIKALSLNQYQVENIYTSKFYTGFASILRTLFNWLPFSMGDILYLLLGCWIVLKIYQLIVFAKSKNKKQYIINSWKAKVVSVFIKLSLVYIIFNIFWGINYNRLGIAYQLNLTLEKYSKDDLIKINELLVQKINTSKSILVNQKYEYPSSAELFLQTNLAYENIAKQYSFLEYKNPSIKKSMWGWLGNYLGFLGYYNPFTGEAQVNTTGPKFAQPFTTCHEVAHQLGYAKEMEANFVGYLAAANSSNTSFKYAVYADLFTYANKTLYYADTTIALNIRKKISPVVIADFKAQRKFYASHKSFFEPVVRFIYGKFLEQNQQPLGILSYDEVTAFIIAYNKKFGTI